MATAFFTRTRGRIPQALSSERGQKEEPLQVGNVAHLFRVQQAQLHGLDGEVRELKSKLSALEAFDEQNGHYYIPESNKAAQALLLEEIAEAEELVEKISAIVEGTLAEMRHRAAR
ncbi:TPA: hypothetical protein DIV48_03515 [Candidatus Kaiserbacteria bacterium]|nr:MAG: hypothetical protein UY93_C0002G0337 [Parcubacteria group bacterium GW2011_GWA1_56_13]KKW46231.1 MAG: hypothetical protein UY97_C0008G0018 [Parcubacteria group bacterium GW2011_GWB1_57_6]HCR52681.1 hypothetical protein [Candidatus Kaiserbacteria bacterium]